MALITAAWLHTPRGVEKGSCLNRPAKGVIVKSVENVVDVVMDYKKIHLHFFTFVLQMNYGRFPMLRQNVLL